MEQMQTRTEHSRSVDDAEQFQALQALIDLGMLIPLTDIDSYHGRVGQKGEPKWTVDPQFANGSNDSGNYNVNKVPTLYTGEEQVAKDFAQERGAIIIRRKMSEILLDKVKNYSVEQRGEWLDRENAEKKLFWDNLTEEQMKLYKPPVTLVDADLDDLARREAGNLRERMSKEQHGELWNSLAKDYRGQVYDIVSTDTDATVLDLSFNPAELAGEAKQRYEQALKKLVIPVTEGSPVGFEERDSVKKLVNALSDSGKRLLSFAAISELAEVAGVSEKVALQFASSFNARQVAMVDPIYLVSKLLLNPIGIIAASMEVDGQKNDLPLNLEYAGRLMRNSHIVGVKQPIRSATLGKSITSVSLFDLEKVDAKENVDATRAEVWHKLGQIASEVGEFPEPEENAINEHLIRLLSDVYAKPEALVQAAKQLPGYIELFDADAGNWEGYTLGEHTETVLRIFDENYADSLPVELLAPMRLALLAHDVGKPLAVADNKKYMQKEYNAVQALDFLDNVGIDMHLKGLLVSVIGDGAELAFQLNIRGAGKDTESKFTSLAKETIKQFNGGTEARDGQIAAFKEMCSMLQICDGAAYTSMAVTRRPGGHGKYRNAPSFNSSFARPSGFGKRGVSLRKAGKAGAPNDLTPNVDVSVSRLTVNGATVVKKPVLDSAKLSPIKLSDDSSSSSPNLEDGFNSSTEAASKAKRVGVRGIRRFLHRRS